MYFLWIIYLVYGYFVDINDQKYYLDCKSTELVLALSGVWRIYSNIQIFLIRIFIRVFVHIIFGYEYIFGFVRGKILIQIFSDIRLYQNFNTNIVGYSFVSKMFIQIYSDIRSYHFLDTNIFGYSFVSKSIRMSHSDLGRPRYTWPKLT